MRKEKFSGKTVKPRGELALIEQIRRLASAGKSVGLTLGIGDDCAILSPPRGHEILVTTDFSLEGRHFRQDWHTPRSVGHRVLARGLSDLASMGAKPLAAFLSLALPRSVAGNDAWMSGFLGGFMNLARQFGVPLAGGDTSEAPDDHVLADIVLLGTARAGTALRRSGARAGDALYCTGALGGAAVELNMLGAGKRKRETSKKNHPHLFPVPRLEVGRRLRKKKLATACIDLSDGLSTDLAHLCSASRVGAEVDAALLPLHALTNGMQRAEALGAAIHGGEDYELLFAASPSAEIPKAIAGVPITRIGKLVARTNGRPQITLTDDRGLRTPLEPEGWEHLR